MKRFRWDKKYLYWGMTAFCVVAAAIVFYMLINHLGWLRGALHKLGGILSPFIWGLVIAYLLYPLMRIYQKYLFEPLAKRLYKKSPKAASAVPKFSRGFSVLLAIISLVVVLGGMLWLVIPQLYSSVESLIVNSTDYVAKADEWFTRLLKDYPEIDTAISGMFGDLSNGLVGWATNNLLPEIKNIVTNLTSSVYYFAKGVYNVLIGIIVSIYVLYSRETFGAHGKKLLYAIFSVEASEKILDGIHFVNKVFMGFISGKILDSLIIGVICYIGCLCMRMPYAVLCSFIVGVTNIIPFFGPLFGMIPTTFIILMEDPIKALIFLLFVILLQQFDGNFLGPKILGNSVGIGGFWVLFSIIVGSGLFGFAGMLLGVPVFVVIYSLFRDLVQRKLGRSGLPQNTAVYVDLDHFDPKTGLPVRIDRAAKHSRENTGKKRRGRKNRHNKTEETADAVPSAEETPDDIPDAPPEDADAGKTEYRCEETVQR